MADNPYYKGLSEALGHVNKIIELEAEIERITRPVPPAKPEIEVSPEMIKAGKSVLCRMDTLTGGDEASWAEEVYRAMIAKRGD